MSTTRSAPSTISGQLEVKGRGSVGILREKPRRWRCPILGSPSATPQIKGAAANEFAQDPETVANKSKGYTQLQRCDPTTGGCMIPPPCTSQYEHCRFEDERFMTR
jgi:hypothetical protein